MGCMTCIEIPGDQAKLQWSALHFDHPDAKDDGEKPWVVGLRRFGFCWGPSQLPLPGVESLIGTFELPVHLQLIPVKSIISTGVSLCDSRTFLESAAGGDMAAVMCASPNLRRASTWAARQSLP